MSDVVPYEGVSVKDRSNPRAIINLIKNTAFETAIMSVPDDVFLLDERDLQKKAKVSVTDDYIKTSFWNEYDLAQAKAKSINVENIYVRGCSRDYFFKQFLTNSYKVAWLLTPPPSYEIMLDTLLSKGLARLYEILNLPLENAVIAKDGSVHYEVDAKIAHVIYQITKDIDIRVKGAIPQFIKSESRNLNITGAVSDLKQDKEPQNMEEIEAELARLQALPHVGTAVRNALPKEKDVIEVEYTPNEGE
jgi:hypothetical protein